MSENFISNLPERFARNVVDSCGALGEQWLSDLPRIIGEIESSWSLQTETHFSNLSYNYVISCICNDGNEAVLKIALPLNNPEIHNEAEFLRLSKGKGTVKLLQYDDKYRVLLLEKLTPGDNLKEIYRKNEVKTVEIVINLINKLLKEPPEKSAFLLLDDWFKGFDKARKTKFPAEYIFKAGNFYEELSSTSKRKYLIHGDLHHENILSARREAFLAIDPKGIIGDVGYEIAVFLNNHAWWLAQEANLREKLNYAVKSFSEAFAIEPLDLRKWAFAQMVLSAWWTYEENGENWEKDLVLAKVWEV